MNRTATASKVPRKVTERYSPVSLRELRSAVILPGQNFRQSTYKVEISEERRSGADTKN